MARYLILYLSLFPFASYAQVAESPADKANGNRARMYSKELLSTEELLQQTPEGLTIIPDIAYREGNEAWKLDMIMPASPIDLY